jgi:hypothetical protein
LVFSFGSCTGIALAALSVLRDRRPESSLMITEIMATISGAALASLFFLGRRKHWLPDTATLRRLLRAAPSFVYRILRPAQERDAHDA